MTAPDDRGSLQEQLADFVHRVVGGPQILRYGDDLIARLNLLERVVEMLRLQTGHVSNDLRMQEVLDQGLAVQPLDGGGARLIFGATRRIQGLESLDAPERHPTELQRPMLLYLLHRHRQGDRIARLIDGFIEAIHPYLSARDVESTGTGVARIATTTRATARALRLHGLLTDSERTAFKTWELSVLGVLVAVRLHRERQGWGLTSRRQAPAYPGRYGGSSMLHPDVVRILRRYQNPSNLSADLLRLCESDREVFATFDLVVETLSAFCLELHQDDSSLDVALKKHVREAALKAAATRMLGTVSDAVMPGFFTKDVRHKLAIDELLQSLENPAD